MGFVGEMWSWALFLGFFFIAKMRRFCLRATRRMRFIHTKMRLLRECHSARLAVRVNNAVLKKHKRAQQKRVTRAPC